MTPKILITGASGGLAQIVAESLSKKAEIIGIDVRPMRVDASFAGRFLHLDYRSKKVEDLFKTESFTHFLHLGRLPTSVEARATQRFNTNVLGTRALLDWCSKYNVDDLAVLSSFHVYGAHQYNPLYLTEKDPLLATATHPQISDVVELDNLAVNYSLRNPDKRVSILRPVNIVGLRIQNHITNYLRNPVCPTLLGYDPAMQFIHETDFDCAIQLVLDKKLSGIFNIAGEGLVPISKAIQLVGSHSIPIPEFLSGGLLKGFGLAGYNFPRHLVDFFKYPAVISDHNFRAATGFSPKVNLQNTLYSIRRERHLLAQS